MINLIISQIREEMLLEQFDSHVPTKLSEHARGMGEIEYHVPA
jgi:hypothetical protein